MSGAGVAEVFRVLDLTGASTNAVLDGVIARQERLVPHPDGAGELPGATAPPHDEADPGMTGLVHVGGRVDATAS